MRVITRRRLRRVGVTDHIIQTKTLRLAVHHGRDQQTDDGHRAERDVARRPEEEVHDDREERRVEPVHRRQGGEDRETHSLRDVDHSDTYPRDDVRQKPVLPLVCQESVYDREVATDTLVDASSTTGAVCLDLVSQTLVLLWMVVEGTVEFLL